MTSNNKEEASQQDVLPTLLFNETYADVHLRAEDSSLVAANRCVLASRSPVFHSMLYDGFREASLDVIDVPGFLLFVEVLLCLVPHWSFDSLMGWKVESELNHHPSQDWFWVCSWGAS